jgi:hypothetical protein
MTAAAPRSARPPCRRRPNRASSHRAARCAFRVPRGQPPPAAARSPGRPWTRRWSRRRRSDRAASRDLLQQPAVAVRVAERRERPVVGVLRRRPDGPVGVADVVEDPARVVEDLGDLDPAPDQVLPRRRDVGHRQLQPLIRARIGPGDPFAEDDRALRPRRRELHHPEAHLVADIIDVHPPAEAFVERFGPIHVGHRHQHNLELHPETAHPVPPRSRALGA